jgi:hypothetical protein
MLLLLLLGMMLPEGVRIVVMRVAGRWVEARWLRVMLLHGVKEVVDRALMLS